LCGISAAALPWLHPRLLPLAAAGVGLLVVRRGPRAARLGAVGLLVLSVAALLLVMQQHYGRASLTAAYGFGFAPDVSLARGPWGALALLLDREFGLLAVGPAWLLAALGLGAAWRRRRGDLLRAVLIGGATFVVGASFSMWWGGSCPPGRFVVPALP